MAELSALDIERVDGVDAPATRRKFLILKAEDPDELRANLQLLAQKVERALQLLSTKSGEFDEETASALEDVAKALDLEITFKKKPKEEYGYPPEEYGKKPAKKSEDEEDLKAYLDARFQELLEALRPAPASEVAKSQQAPGPVEIEKPRVLGKGLFTDIVFGR